MDAAPMSLASAPAQTVRLRRLCVPLVSREIGTLRFNTVLRCWLAQQWHSNSSQIEKEKALTLRIER